MASQDWLEKDFYKVLGVDKSISQADLKKAYRKLARQYHPDSNPGDAKAEARFKEISEAYSILSDEEQRAEYDQIRAMGAGGARFTAGGAGGGQAGGFEDVFSNLFGGGGGGRTRTTSGGRGGQSYEDLLGGLFGGAGGGGFGQSSGGFRGFGGPTQGRDVTATTRIDFLTATKGDTVTLSGGEGAPVKVRIPAGVTDGQKLKLRGKGEPSPDGGEAGDLVLTVHVEKHPVFERDGLNLRVNLPVTFTEAALGATVEVPTLGGDPVRMKVPAGTSSGRILRLKGRGVETKTGKGDLLARVEVAVPSHLSSAQKEALDAFAAASTGENPRDDLLAKARA